MNAQDSMNTIYGCIYVNMLTDQSEVLIMLGSRGPVL